MSEVIEAPQRHERGEVVLDKGDWMQMAMKFVLRRMPSLQHHNDDYYVRERGVYRRIEDATVRAEVWSFLTLAMRRVKDDDRWVTEQFNPSTQDVNQVLDAVRALKHLSLQFAPPCWLPDGKATEWPPIEDVLAFPNGILDIGTGEFTKPTAHLFTTSCVGFDYPKDGAPEPKEWLAFLREIFGGEQDQIDALQEFFGYAISQDVSQEKAFMMVGPKRSGKDTSRHMLQSLLPSSAVCGPTLSSLGTNFGMSQLIEKQLAVVGDVRIGGKTDRDLLAENILKLTGRGFFTIDRKFKDHWSGPLMCKLLLLTNEFPMLKDAAGALANRFIIFCTRKSFYGEEDPHLFRDKLAPEKAGVLLWALDGLRRMRERGRIAEPACSLEQRKQLARDGSPVLSFIGECLALDPAAEVVKADLYGAFLDYAAVNGLHNMASNAFVRALVAATGGKAAPSRVTDDDGRKPSVSGVRIERRPPERAKRQRTGGEHDVF